jgi:hypothetical protein
MAPPESLFSLPGYENPGLVLMQSWSKAMIAASSTKFAPWETGKTGLKKTFS